MANIDVLPLLALRGMLVFPYMTVPLDVGREKSVSALEDAMMNNRLIVLAAQKETREPDPSPDGIHSVGTVAEVKQLAKISEGTIRILVEGIVRVQILDYVQNDPHFRVKISSVVDPKTVDREIEALMRTALRHFEEYVKLNRKIPPEILVSVSSIEEPGRLADDIASHLPLKVDQKQAVLECLSPKERLEKVCMLLMKEIEILELERKIHSRVRKQMERTQREYYLREQLKAIQKELGDRDDRAQEIAELREKVESLGMPEEALEKAQKEIDRLERMPPMVAEAVVVRNYLDWLISYPWSVKTEDGLDIKQAERILNEDHYGLDKVKERILEYLSVRQLTKKIRGPILCFVGPPGVGKTSLGKSIARALGRKFVRFSLGGVRDEAEIRGHRRTYVGAMPGRIIQAMKQAGTSNPVILLDEIDKLASDFRGDPASALLEVLDPEQNCNFSDHYMEVTVDLSDVMFITTANVLYDIPHALRDRMEIIRIPGYTEDEKVQIALRHLLPNQLRENGLTNKDVFIGEKSIREIIRSYTRESGVRELERKIATVLRKAAKEIVSGASRPIRVLPKNIHRFLGIPLYRFGVMESEDRVGVATGLAWTEVGGEILSIEVSVMQGKGQLNLTGKLGDVMKESAQAGFSYVRSRAESLGVDPDFHEKYDVHIHVPEGAIPKDGPSAGIAMATALVSALTDKPVRRDVAMTGEITLRGRVLPIGGLKEKVLAAHRSGIRTVILPAENARDIDEIPDNIKQEMTFVTVDHMDEVLVVALRDFRLTSDDSGRSEIIPMTENVHDQGSGASLQV
ncbi:MAG: endopeptidase La [Bacillota bacterium]|nr:endopeptidase La [Bacillota bacterium]HPZ54071.1 endopeptidase La [Bacillota bacterium]HQD18179.1 endopeptidase La [Bacillota bacterium]